jgi:hypothetical protein
MRPEPSVHDNIVYAYTVDCEARRLVLHTVFRHRETNEFTDVVFREVVAHDFSNVLPGNILFDVAESDIAKLILENKELFAESWRYGWPPVDYNGDLNVLLEALRAAAVRAYSIGSSFGLSGWVLAGSCERKSRRERATVA